jgi:hypothetical protein
VREPLDDGRAIQHADVLHEAFVDIGLSHFRTRWPPSRRPSRAEGVIPRD